MNGVGEGARAALAAAALFGVPLAALGLLGGVPVAIELIAVVGSVVGGAAVATYPPGTWRELALGPPVAGLAALSIAGSSGVPGELVAGVAAVGILVWRAAAGPDRRRLSAPLVGAAATPLLGVALAVVVANLAPTPTADIGIAAVLVAVGVLLVAGVVLVRSPDPEQATPS